MGEHARLENSGKVLRGHAILVRLGGKDGEQVENVEEKLAVQGRQLGDELLVLFNGALFVKVVDKLGSLGVSRSLCGGATQRVAESFVQVEGDDWLRKIVEVSAQDVGGIVNCVSVPDEALAVSIGRVEDELELLYALFRAA